jgi:hypothetical protein
MKYYPIFLFFWIFQSCQPAKHIPDEIQIWLDQLQAERTLLATSFRKSQQAFYNYNETKDNQYDSLVALADSVSKVAFELTKILQNGIEILQTDSSARAWTTPQITNWYQQIDAQIFQLKPLFYQFVDSAYQYKPVGFPQKIWVDSVLNIWNVQTFQSYNSANKLLYISLLQTSVYGLLCQTIQASVPKEQHFGVAIQTLPYLEFANETIYKSRPLPLRIEISEQIVLPNPKIHLYAYDPAKPNKPFPISYSQNKVVVTDTPKTKGKHTICFRAGVTHEATGESIGLSREWTYVVE